MSEDKKEESAKLNVYLSPQEAMSILNCIDATIRQPNSDINNLASFKFQLQQKFIDAELLKAV